MSMIHPKLSSITLPWPVNWDDFFGVERPLIVEIGFGNGDHLVALAQAYADCHVVGFEISSKSLDKAERKITRHDLTHARAIHAAGETALHHLIAPGRVREFHINYPDPWFKTRHAGRRLIQRDTVDVLANRLEPGGLLYLATDIQAYAEMSHEILSTTSGLENTLDTPWTDHLPERLITTKYEARGMREGRPGKYFRYRRTDDPVPQIPIQEEWPMAHLILETPMPLVEIADRVEKTAFHARQRPSDESATIHVALLAAYVNPARETLLLEVIIEEATIEQHIMLALTPRQSDAQHYILQAASIGKPRMTAGLHHAVGFLGDWIADLHPEAQVTDRFVSIS